MRKICLILAFTLLLGSQALAQNSGPSRGFIKGDLIYPSDEIPQGLILCATRVLKVSYTVCSTSSNKRGLSFFINRARQNYTIGVPAGTYYVYATFPKGRAPTADMEEYKAYYTEFVRCGMSVKCKSHRRIKIRVKRRQVKSGITIGDWYN